MPRSVFYCRRCEGKVASMYLFFQGREPVPETWHHVCPRCGVVDAGDVSTKPIDRTIEL